MIATLLIGEPKSGKTRSLETLPGGTVLFAFDKGGWKSLDSAYDNPTVVANKIPRKRLKKLKFPPKDDPTLRGWLATGDVLAKDEILVVEYVSSDLISIDQYVKADSSMFINFGRDVNELWNRRQECIDKGIWHVSIDSLTTFKNAIIEFMKVMSGNRMLTLPNWGWAIDKMIEVFDSIRGTDFDFILICHIQSEKDEVTGKIISAPLVFGKGLPKEVLIRFDDNFMASTDRGQMGQEYFWVPVPIDFLVGVGTRNFDDLPGRIEPNFGKLYGARLIHGETKKEAK
jgi:hypothetical protein